MAAYAALLSAARTLDECCNDINNVPDGSLDHGKEEVEIFFRSLLQSFNSLEAFLEEFPEEAEVLEGRIRDVAYKAEDLIEDFMLKLQQETGSDQECCSHFQDLSREMQKVNQEVHSIEDEVLKIKNTINTEIHDLKISIDDPSSKLAPPTASTGKDDVVMVGFGDQLTAIKERLCGHSTKLQVIPISGMGGIGKTTLARNAFDDRLTKERFDLRAWATVSQTYSVREIFTSLLLSCDVLGDKTSNKSVEWLKERMYKSLKGRRYLIVLDDVWSTEACDEVIRLFPDENNGSRVLLTTRLSEVAEYAVVGSNILIHSMKFLDANQSWNLLQEKVFSPSSLSSASRDDDDRGNNVCPPELEDIGKEIARRCGGLPLTIVVIAGILKNVSRTLAAWEEIARKVIAIAVAESSRDERIANVLSLSYRHLPHRMRPCLLYMAAFPEDREIPVKHLSKIWTAEGILKRRPPISTTGSSSSSSSACNNIKSFEETTAEEYMEELVRRSLVLVSKRNFTGRIKSCSVHDLLRDMCIRKAQEEKFLLRVNHTEDPVYRKGIILRDDDHQNLRRVSGNGHWLVNMIEKRPYSSSAPSIHTVLSFQKRRSITTQFSVPTNDRFLRVIHTPDLNSCCKLTQVLKLFRLRYLHVNLDSQKMYLENKDTYKFKKLQTLVLGKGSLSPNHDWAPNILEMPQLRHLQAASLYIRNYRTETCTTLENLQTLDTVENLQCSVTIMRSMPNLKKLGLSYRSLLLTKHNLSVYQLQNLVHLRGLETLKLRITRPLYDWRISSRRNFCPPQTLRKLRLQSCKIEWEEVGVMASFLPNLECLILECDSVTGQVWETKERQFPRLKVLRLDDLEYLEQWITESSDHFPSLQCLRLLRCDRLLEIPDCVADIPTLQSIWIRHCSESVMEWARRIKCEQQDMGNDDLQVEISGVPGAIRGRDSGRRGVERGWRTKSCFF